MKIDNQATYRTAWGFEPTGEPVETTLGTTRLVSNGAGLYGVVASNLLILVTDNWTVANGYVKSIAKYDPEYPYEAIFNGESRGGFRDLAGEGVISWGSGVRAWNTIQVYYKGELVLDIDTDNGEIVNTRVRHEMTLGWEED